MDCLVYTKTNRNVSEYNLVLLVVTDEALHKTGIMLSSIMKHVLHCCLLLIVILIFEFVSGGLQWNIDKTEQLDPWVRYGFFGALILYLLRSVTFLSLPQVLFNFVGLTIYNAFPDKVILKGSPLLAPFICIRIVTRGDYPQLVKTNVNRNLNKCIEAGLENFQIEVVSDKPIGLVSHRRITEIVVPANYRTSSGALFKARALQYCLENSVNELADHDWIVHLDEETLMTENSIRGILNFVLDGKHQFGQGLITYANEDVVNWITTLADSFRVADDMGKLRLQFTMFHKPLFSMKGSYVVTQMAAEREVSFNNGLDGSVAEDCFFAMKAFSQGYTFNFVDGEMWEKSPFTLWDFVQQRKRWLQAWLCPISCSPLIDFLCAFIGAVNIYMYVFGVVKSFSLYRFGIIHFLLCLCGALSTIPFNLIIENVAVIWGLFGKKHKFYVVNKEYKPPITV
ncbi:hypothetical protein HZH66_008865 [Vespula vulgaris]|uniref:Glycosyltransferase 2-like domain-containing protein n=1 Tax=Vespula vulgaris TaxID=7454 RepID=A0A834N1K6_VESVU|nr:hypothetical protein HZH66_008865 [Vespula vulgaris]